MSKLSRDTQELIARGRGGPAIPNGERARLKRAVLAGIAAGSTAAVTTATATATWISVAAKIGGMATLAGVVVVGVGIGKSHVGRTYEAPRAGLSATSPRSPAQVFSTAAAALPKLEEAASVSTLARQAQARPPADMPVTVDPSSIPEELSRGRTGATLGGSPPYPLQHPASPLAAAEATHAPDLAAPHPSSRSLGGGAPTSSETMGRSPAWDSLLGEEARLVREASEAARSGDTTHALALLDEHAARFPYGALEPERSAERVLILCATGRAEETLVAKAEFLQKHASGPLAARVRESCARLPAR
jgi:hypothetical protein